MTTQITEVGEHARPYQHRTIDELFEEFMLDAREAKGLIEFALSLYGADTEAKIDASAVKTFLESLFHPIERAEDALRPILYELREREQDRQDRQTHMDRLPVTDR